MRISTIKLWANRVKRDLLMLYFAAKDIRTPFYLRLIAFAVVGYAFSPIDLIPDFIPIIGYLDDLLLVPLGLLLVVKLLPLEIVRDCRRQAMASMENPKSRKFTAVVVGTWILFIALFAMLWFI